MTDEQLKAMLTKAVERGYAIGWQAAMDSLKPTLDELTTQFESLKEAEKQLRETLQGPW